MGCCSSPSNGRIRIHESDLESSRQKAPVQDRSEKMHDPVDRWRSLIFCLVILFFVCLTIRYGFTSHSSSETFKELLAKVETHGNVETGYIEKIKVLNDKVEGHLAKAEKHEHAVTEYAEKIKVLEDEAEKLKLERQKLEDTIITQSATLLTFAQQQTAAAMYQLKTPDVKDILVVQNGELRNQRVASGICELCNKAGGKIPWPDCGHEFRVHDKCASTLYANYGHTLQDGCLVCLVRADSGDKKMYPDVDMHPQQEYIGRIQVLEPPIGNTASVLSPSFAAAYNNLLQHDFGTQTPGRAQVLEPPIGNPASVLMSPSFAAAYNNLLQHDFGTQTPVLTAGKYEYVPLNSINSLLANTNTFPAGQHHPQTQLQYGGMHRHDATLNQDSDSTQTSGNRSLGGAFVRGFVANSQSGSSASSIDPDSDLETQSGHSTDEENLMAASDISGTLARDSKVSSRNHTPPTTKDENAKTQEIYAGIASLPADIASLPADIASLPADIASLPAGIASLSDTDDMQSDWPANSWIGEESTPPLHQCQITVTKAEEEEITNYLRNDPPELTTFNLNCNSVL
eukprot:653598_1